MQKYELRRIILSQQSFFQKHQDLIPRDQKIDDFLRDSEVVMICGIRGCGKTSFLKQIAEELDGIKVYINFEAIRPEDFEPRNFQDLRDIISELVSEFHGNSGKELGVKELGVKELGVKELGVKKLGVKELGVKELGVKELDEKAIEKGGDKQIYYFLEEIQHIPLWELWLDSLYEQGIKVFVTGSNSKFLSSGNGLFLSGRNRQFRLFPFSFKEYLRVKEIEIPKTDLDSFPSSKKDEILSHFLKYFDKGGFPLVIINDEFELSRKYFEEILQKEILDRHEIEDVEGLRRLAVFLFSNVASEYSFETLKKVSGIQREETVRLYLDYLEEAFLLYRVPMLNHSRDNGDTHDNAGTQDNAATQDKAEKKKWKENEMTASCKVYAGDTGFFRTVAANYPDSLGLRFENLVFLELLRRGKEVFVFRDRKECDFVLMGEGRHGQEITGAIQVSTYFGNPAVREREIEGLLGAMQEYGLEEGLILTLDDEEVLMPDCNDFRNKCQGLESRGMKKIVVKPVWKWLIE